MKHAFAFDKTVKSMNKINTAAKALLGLKPYDKPIQSLTYGRTEFRSVTPVRGST